MSESEVDASREAGVVAERSRIVDLIRIRLKSAKSQEALCANDLVRQWGWHMRAVLCEELLAEIGPDSKET